MEKFFRYLGLVLPTLAFMACTDNSVNNIEEVTATFEISGMTCSHGCANTIEERLNETEGVLQAEVIFEDNRCHISYDNATLDEKQIVAVVESIGGGDKYGVTNFLKENKQGEQSNMVTTPKKDEKNKQILGKPILQPLSFPNIFLALVRGVTGERI